MNKNQIVNHINTTINQLKNKYQMEYFLENEVSAETDDINHDEIIVDLFNSEEIKINRFTDKYNKNIVNIWLNEANKVFKDEDKEFFQLLDTILEEYAKFSSENPNDLFESKILK